MRLVESQDIRLRPPPFVDSFALALNKARVLALNTAHVLRLNKADVLALNKAHVLRLNNKICPVFSQSYRTTFCSTFSYPYQLKPILLRAFLESHFPEMLSKV